MFNADQNIKLYDLSKDATGNPDRPTYSHIRAIAAQQNWTKARNLLYEARGKKKSKAAIGARFDGTSVEILTPEVLENLDRDLARPIGYIDSDPGYPAEELPDHLQERYATAIADPHLMNLRKDVALMSTLIQSCTRRMKNGEPSARHAFNLRKIAKALVDAKKSGDEQLAGQALSEMLRLISKGSPEVELQAELINLVETRMRLITAEANRLKLLQAYMAREDALNGARQFAEAVKQHVKDPTALKAIAQDFKRIRSSLSTANRDK